MRFTYSKKSSGGSGERGAALIPALMVVSMLAMLGLSSLSAGLSGSKVVTGQSDEFRLTSAVESVGSLTADHVWSGYLRSQGGAASTIATFRTYLTSIGIVDGGANAAHGSHDGVDMTAIVPLAGQNGSEFDDVDVDELRVVRQDAGEATRLFVTVAAVTKRGKGLVDKPLSREDVTDYDQLGSTRAAQGYGDTNTAVPHKLTSRTSVNTVAAGMARLVIETDLQVPLPNAIYPDFKVEVAENNELSTPPLPGKWRMTVTVNGQDSAVFGSNPSSTYQQIDESPVRGVLTTKQGTSTVYQIGLDDLRPWRTAMAWNPMRIVVDIGGDPRTIVDSNAVYAPAYGASVGRTFQVSGVAHNFEANVVIRVLDDKQKEILKTFTTAANCCDPGGTFDATVQLPANVTGNIFLEVFEASARDGSDLKLIRIPLTVR